MTKRKILW